MTVGGSWSAGWAALVVLCLGCVSGQSSDSSLSNFTLECDQQSKSSIFDSSECSMSPTFASNSTSEKNYYYISPANRIRVTPTATHNGSFITVDGQGVTSGSPSSWIDLPEGEKKWYECNVTAEDGSSTIYYFSSGSDYDRPWLSLAWMVGCFFLLRIFLALNQLRRWFNRKIELSAWRAGGGKYGDHY